MAPKQLHLHTANRVEELGRSLVRLSKEQPLPNPLAQETVVTLNPGMARWLQFQVASQTGVAFGWDFPLPGKLFRRLVSGFHPDFETAGAYDENVGRWRILDLLPTFETDPDFAKIRSYCAAGSANRRFRFANRMAALFDEYLVYRPDRLLEWEDGRAEDGWQSKLWQCLLAELFPDDPQPLHLARLWDRLRTRSPSSWRPHFELWPERLCVFGVSSLAPLYLDFLDAFSHFRPVHIFLLQPSDLYWADLKSRRQIDRIAARDNRENSDELLETEDWIFDSGNPLLPALGKQGQGFLDLLVDRNPIQDDSAFVPPDAGDSQLSALQSDLFTLADRGDPESFNFPETPFPGYDGSLQLHASATRRREVEALWDYLITRFDGERPPQPNQILVMAPEIQDYKPHIEAVFGRRASNKSLKVGLDRRASRTAGSVLNGPLGDRSLPSASSLSDHLEDDEQLDIPFSIADRSGQIVSPVLSGFEKVLRLVDGKAGAPELVEVLETPLVRERFAFSENELAIIDIWIRELGITWGWNAEHRAQRQAFATDRNTWKELRLRLSAGIAFGDEVSTTSFDFLPFSEIEGDLVDLAGRLLEFLELLARTNQGQTERRPIARWQPSYLALAGSLECEAEEWISDQQSLLAIILEALPDEAQDILIAGSEATAAILNKLQHSSSIGGYISGGVTFCSLKPMRAIPADTICLIGMNQADFPRKSTRLSFDLLERNRRLGDRNTRDEDRQFFLETLLSARSHLYLSYLGISPSSETTLEPSSVVSELQAYLQRCLSKEEFAKLHANHPRQSYDSEYFRGGPLFTYDSKRAELNSFFARNAKPQSVAELESTESRSRDDSEAIWSSLPHSLTPIELDALLAFFKDPAAYFAQSALGLRYSQAKDQLEDDDDLLLDGLDSYRLRDYLAEAVASGEDLERLDPAKLSAHKLLAPGHLETIVFDEELDQAKELAQALNAWTAESQPTRRRLRLNLGDATLLGQLDLDPKGRLLLLTPGELKAQRLMSFWIRHLVANLEAVKNGLAPQATLILSLHPKQSTVHFTPPANPSELLPSYCQAYLDGQQSPLPLLPELTHKLATRTQSSRSPQTLEAASLAALAELEAAREGSLDYSSFSWTRYDELCFAAHPFTAEELTIIASKYWIPILDNLKPGTPA